MVLIHDQPCCATDTSFSSLVSVDALHPVKSMDRGKSVPSRKRRFGDVRVPSALPLKADILRKRRHVSKVPTRDSCIAVKGYPLGHRFHSATLRPGVADFLLLADPFQLAFVKHSGSARRFHDVPHCGVSPREKTKELTQTNISDRPLQPRNHGAIGRRVCKSLRIARLAAAAARCLSVCPLTIEPSEKIFSSRNSSNLASAYSAAAITQ
jgi:hypothetical protein